MTIHSCLRRIAWYCDESIMSLVDSIRSEADRDKREQLTRELMATLVERPPGLLLFEAVSFDAYSDTVQGFRAGYGIIEYENIARAR